MKPSWTAARVLIDRIRPDGPVTRTVRGIPMVLPRRHILPYMATDTGPYAQNLVDLAELLRRTEDDLVVLDVGANVGDSALLILDRVDCRVVCVEGDPQWLTYLHRNVDGVEAVTVEEALLSDDSPSTYVSIVHAAVGSSHVAAADATTGTATLPMTELLARHPQLGRVRLVKTDTDGFDVKLTTGYARTFAASRPVIFFEYDPRPTEIVTPELRSSELWADLVALGYEHAVVWTNGGHVLGSCPVADLTERCAVLETGRDTVDYEFWDVAVAHRDDPEGLAVLAAVADRGVRWPGSGTF